MKFTVNGEALELDAGNLADLLAKLDYEGDWLATAVNGDLVHREEGDRIEILSPMQGG